MWLPLQRTSISCSSGKDEDDALTLFLVWPPRPQDAVPGFAPSLKTMLTNFGGSYETAAKAYCGLEAIVTTPEGRTATLFIADAFDDTCVGFSPRRCPPPKASSSLGFLGYCRWVRTPSSIDVVYGSFPLLFGRQTDNKLECVSPTALSCSSPTRITDLPPVDAASSKRRRGPSRAGGTSATGSKARMLAGSERSR